MRFKEGQQVAFVHKLTVVRYTRGGLVLCEIIGRHISLPEYMLISDKYFTMRPLSKWDKIKKRIKKLFLASQPTYSPNNSED